MSNLFRTGTLFLVTINDFGVKTIMADTAEVHVALSNFHVRDRVVFHGIQIYVEVLNLIADTALEMSVFLNVAVEMGYIFVDSDGLNQSLFRKCNQRVVNG